MPRLTGKKSPMPLGEKERLLQDAIATLQLCLEVVELNWETEQAAERIVQRYNELKK